MFEMIRGDKEANLLFSLEYPGKEETWQYDVNYTSPQSFFYPLFTGLSLQSGSVKTFPGR